MHAFLEASFSPPNLDQDVLAVWVVFWGMYRHSAPHPARAPRDLPRGMCSLLRSMLQRPAQEERPHARVDLRLAAIGLTALLDGLWLEWCLEPGNFRPAERRCAKPGSTIFAVAPIGSRHWNTAIIPSLSTGMFLRFREASLATAGRARIVIVGCGFGGLFAAMA